MSTEIEGLNIKKISILERSLTTIQENLLVVDPTKKDPMIARNLEVWQYVGIIALAAGLVVLVRVLSPRVEHAILLAIFLSVVLIIFFVTG